MLVFIIVACAKLPASQTGDQKNAARDKIVKFESTQELKKFSSAQEVLDYVKKSQAKAQDGGIFYGRGLGISQTMDVVESSMAKASDSGIGAESPASDYSTTNIQVEGVDEADFVKNDGKYIYTLTQNKLVIVDAFPAENAKILSETRIDGRLRDMFLNKDRLVLFVERDGEVPVFSQYDYMPRPRYTSVTHVYVYDIADRENPEIVKDYNINGYYAESRMIDDDVYFIVRDDVHYYAQTIDLPVIKQASTAVLRPDIYYFDNPEFNHNFHTIASFNVFEDDNRINAKTFMMGYSNSIYVSEDNIYITYQKNLPYTYYKTHNEDRFYEVVLPLLPSGSKSRIEEIKNDDGLSKYEKWERISDVLEEMYNVMGETEEAGLINDIEKKLNEYEFNLEKERRKTVIHRIEIGNGKIEYGSKGEVQGYLLNQFSMDEHEGYFRVATTTELYGVDKAIMHNNVYVLNEDLETVGKIEGIAPDERIYSVRFIGDRLYMVTFQRIDPLFVIDLSSPQNPEILGELKIPGFSDYLHPYDENHIIGIGKQTEGNEWGGISVKGVKLALFDVSDVQSPRQVNQYEMGEAGTDSEALRDHKAFLFDREKELLVIPVTEITGKQTYDPRYGYYRQRFWQGAYVFSLTPENGFQLKGKITHKENDERDYYNWYGENTVRRSLFMDDVLYTLSESKIKMNDLNDINHEIAEINLPYEQPVYYPYPVPYGGK